MKRKYDIKWEDSVDSTNNEALARIHDTDVLSVLAAREQTSGRGQRGNVWKTVPGQNLTFSIMLKFGTGLLPPFPAIRQFRLSQAAALSVVSFLKDNGIAAKIKWPNDIYAGNLKICGILIENSVSGAELRHSIIGIGLNVNQKEFPADLPNPTSMSIETGKEYPCLDIMLEKYITEFDRWLDMVLSDASATELAGIYGQNLYGDGKTMEYRDTGSGERFSARISGVTETGMLRLEDISGQIREYAFKEVELSLAKRASV